MKKIWIALATLALAANAATPVEVHGTLSVQGSKVVNKNGEPAKLSGMSLFWSQWISKYWNAKVVDWLADDWKISVIRAAMAVEEGGYLETAATQEARVRKVVDAAIARGIYVIVDWHDHNAVDHQAQAVDFFQRMARDYGAHPNVIWEIYNEPVKQEWWRIKDYATAVSRAIRQEDPDNLIIVGNPDWSSAVDKPAADPVPGTNIAYTLHFYAASHGQWLRDRADAAMGKGIALFATEWGTCEATGDGRLGYSETADWLSWMDQRGISWANWSIADKAETCSALNGGASSSGGWTAANLSASGTLLRDELRKRNAWYGDIVVKVDTFPLPGTIDGGRPARTVGARTEPDASGSGLHLAYIDDRTSATWMVRAASNLVLNTEVSVASQNAGGDIRWILDEQEIGRSSVRGTTGWGDWSTQAGIRFPITAGTHALRLEFSGSGIGLFNLDAISATGAPLSIAPRAPVSPAWRIEEGSLVVSGLESGVARLRSSSGALLGSGTVRAGQVRLAMPKTPGFAILEVPGSAPLRVPVGF
jgi:endoglucanase